MKKISVEIKGITPLLMNRFRDSQIEGKSKKSKGEEKERVLEDKLYLDSNNKPYVPAVYFLRCLTDAGKRLQVRGKGKSTYSKLVGSTVQIEPDAIVLNGKFSEFRTSAVNPMTHGRMIIARPMFRDWSCKFEIVLSDESISFETMNELLSDAGKYTGIGDWRPEKKGMYGKFVVVSFKEEK